MSRILRLFEGAPYEESAAMKINNEPNHQRIRATVAIAFVDVTTRPTAPDTGACAVVTGGSFGCFSDNDQAQSLAIALSSLGQQYFLDRALACRGAQAEGWHVPRTPGLTRRGV